MLNVGATLCGRPQVTTIAHAVGSDPLIAPRCAMPGRRIPPRAPRGAAARSGDRALREKPYRIRSSTVQLNAPERARRVSYWALAMSRSPCS